MNNTQFTQEDLKNILVLISNSPIKGGEAEVVVLLKQKITKMLTPEVEEKPVDK